MHNGAVLTMFLFCGLILPVRSLSFFLLSLPSVCTEVGFQVRVISYFNAPFEYEHPLLSC